MLYVLVESKTGKILTKTRINSLDSKSPRRCYSFINTPTPKLDSVIKRFNSLSPKIQDKVDIGELVLSETRHTAKDIFALNARAEREKVAKQMENAKIAHAKKMATLEKQAQKLDKQLS